jgi:hypothetical protein
VQRSNRVVTVVLTTQERGQLQLVEIGADPLQRASELALRLRVGALLEELVQDLGLLDPFGQVVIPLQLRSEGGERAGQPLPAAGVVPYPRL